MKGPPKYLLITGCPRSGTKFISKVMTSLGVLTSHEEVFHPCRLDSSRRPWRWATRLRGDPWVGESSWVATHYLSSLREVYGESLYVVRIVRAVEDVTRSLMKIGFFSEDPATTKMGHVRWLHERYPEFWAADDPVARTHRFYREWNAEARAGADFTMPLVAAATHVGTILRAIGEKRDEEFVRQVVEFWAKRRPNARS